jgi:hypothetical protein
MVNMNESCFSKRFYTTRAKHTEVCEVRRQLEVVDDLFHLLKATLNVECQHAAECVLAQRLERKLV